MKLWRRPHTDTRWKKNNNNATEKKKTSEIWKCLYLPCGVRRKKTLVPSTAPLAPSQRWISRFSLQFDFIAAPPFSALHLWVSYIPPECAWMRCRFSGLSKIHRAAICVWHSPRRTYLCFTLSPSNTFISSLSSILFCAVVFLISSLSAGPSLSLSVSVFLISYNATRLYLFLSFPPARLRALLLRAVRGQRHQSPLLFEQSTQTGGPASRWVSRPGLLPPHISASTSCFMALMAICTPVLTNVVVGQLMVNLWFMSDCEKVLQSRLGGHCVFLQTTDMQTLYVSSGGLRMFEGRGWGK